MDQHAETTHTETNANDRAQLEAISRAQEAKDPLKALLATPKSPGDNEFDALSAIARNAGWMGFLGIIASGAALGTVIYPLVGTIAGAFWAGVMGLVPAVVAIALYIISRGRLSPRVAMSWAGAAAGAGCGLVAIEGSYTHPVMAILMVSIPGLCGAIGGRWGAAKGVAKYRIVEGRGYRRLSQFAIVDMLLVTAWLAGVLTLMQIFVRVARVNWSVLGVWIAASVISTGTVSGFAWLLKSKRKEFHVEQVTQNSQVTRST